MYLHCKPLCCPNSTEHNSCYRHQRPKGMLAYLPSSHPQTPARRRGLTLLSQSDLVCVSY